MITLIQIACLLSGFILFAIFPWFWSHFSVATKADKVKKRILLKLPFLGALISLTLFKAWGVEALSAFFLVTALVQLYFLMKNKKRRAELLPT